MTVVTPSYRIITDISEGGKEELRRIERVARNSYQSQNDDFEKTKKFVSNLIAKGHESPLEFSQLEVQFICDRGISHEIVRHRLFSFNQESTRYCKYNDGIQFVAPYWTLNAKGEYIGESFEPNSVEGETFRMWKLAMMNAEDTYIYMLDHCACSPQMARAVLPNSTKTSLLVSGNYREWRNFFKLRTAPDAHPDMLKLTAPLLKELQEKLPIIFDMSHA